MTTIVNYGAGNVRSVQNTFEELGAPYEVVNERAKVQTAKKIVLPGVGHFGQMMRALDDLGLRDVLIEKIRTGTPLLGICVGLQCLFEGSDESPEAHGLAVLPGYVKRFSGPVRVPHMGWNSLERVRPSKLLAGLSRDVFTYFAHSYYAPVVPATTATCVYVHSYTAVIEQENLYAVQFHPEKSGTVGLRVLGNFLAI